MKDAVPTVHSISTKIDPLSPAIENGEVLQDEIGVIGNDSEQIIFAITVWRESIGQSDISKA